MNRSNSKPRYLDDLSSEPVPMFNNFRCKRWDLTTVAAGIRVDSTTWKYVCDDIAEKMGRLNPILSWLYIYIYIHTYIHHHTSLVVESGESSQKC